MSNTVDSLILDLLEWIGPNARLYTEVIEAWRTSCPRLPVWEEASERGFIVRHYEPGRETVAVTALGAEHVRTHRPVGVAV
jgi:D-3-phosphoglycerate dehydrogenase